MTERTVGPASLWQHPYVDVFKHYRLDKNDWKQNKKHGDVQEIFAKEIGRKAFQLNGSISANNYIQIPHPQCPTKSLQLTGRYIYMEFMTFPGIPANFHFDFAIAERTQNLRISCSNLFKNFTTSNGNVIQVPLELKTQKWAVVRLDVQDLLERSKLFPKSYKIESCHQLKAMQLCANCLIRGVYTSDNDYEFTNLPADMKFKFAFDLQRWPEFFQWFNLPQAWDSAGNPDNQTGKHVHYGEKTKEEERKIMDEEINELLRRGKTLEQVEEAQVAQLESAAQSRKGNSSYMGKSLLQQQKERQPLQEVQGFMQSNAAASKKKGEIAQMSAKEQKKSSKMNQDPILELEHIIGYSPDKCQEIQWIKKVEENVALFASGGTLIAMDVAQKQQRKFYFGHSAPICCFDSNSNGTYLASGQEGKNPLVRIWEYDSGRCLSMFTLNVNSIQCLSFSHDGKYLATVGRGNQNREQIIVWDISGIGKGQQPTEHARQSAEFNIISLKFSPLDSERLVSCGKENVRFWRIRENRTIRGSAVVLNHHARNSVFTCLDFDHSFFSSKKEEEHRMSRVFVGSKHGQVYQINYFDEKLEGNFSVSETAIYSLSVNAAFCAVGSEDRYLRVWSLDFSHFNMEAKHEGTVCSVDMSPDGLKVACGTLTGAIGIVEKANSKYVTLLRAHTADIVSMDMQNDKIITASSDSTIRIWDRSTFDQDYEFSTPVDLPLAVAAHPSLPLFSCGFESGVLRVFDIEKTSVCDEFVQFNKPLTKLAYSPKSDLLVTCCKDGSIAVHNAQRQHLPTKMMHLEFPPQYVHVAFTQESDESQSLFATMGEHGNSVRIHESETFALKHSLNTGHILTAFSFAQHNRELVCSTQDCKLLFFSLSKYEGVFLREINTVHRGLITSLDVSSNSGFILTGGQDNMIKVWDYEAPKANTEFYQAFIGHINSVNNVKFLKGDNSKVVSTGSKDGIYAWAFHGDISTNYAHEFGATEGVKQIEEQAKPQFGQSILQRMRQTKKKEDKYNTFDNGFALPPFKQLQGQDPEAEEKKQVLFEMREYTGPYKFYNNKAAAKLDLKLEEEEIDNEIKPVIMNGYDGTNGVHDNLHWLSNEGWQVYTLHNKVIFEKTKSRDQQVLADSSVQLSTLAVSPDRRFIAVGEGSKNEEEVAYVLLYEIERTAEHPFFKLVLKNKLSFHQRGVQALAFSNCSRFLISAGVEEEGTLAVSEVETGLVLKSSSVKSGCITDIAVDPFIITDHIQFSTVGAEGSLMLWRMDANAEQLQYYEVQGMPSSLANSHFVTCAYTENLGGSYNSYFTLIGTSDGSLAAFDNKTNSFLQAGHKQGALRGQIGHIKVNGDSAVLGSSGGSIARYFIKTGEDQFSPFPQHNLKIYNLDSAVTSLSMDEQNNEGLVGTEHGTIYYINFEEKILLKLLVTHHGSISSLKFGLSEEGAQELLLTAAEGMVSVRSAQTMDQVLQFKTKVKVSQVLQCPTDLKKCIFVHENGLVQFVSLNKLKVEGILKLSLQDDEKVCAGAFNSNGINFAVGTTTGTIVFGRITQDAWTSPLKVSISIVNDLQAGAVTHIAFSPHDTIGTFLAAFDSGVVKQWQSTIQNDQFRKLMELLPNQNSNQCLDLAEEGAQRVFQVNDEFNLFENPHGLDEIEEEDRQRLKDLYGGRKHPNTHCFFAPRGSADLYFSTVEALQYIFVRNSVTGTVVQRVSLMAFPMSLALEVGDETSGEAVLAYVGCKEGVLLKTQIDATSSKLLARTREGTFYGAITSVDVFRDIVAVGNRFGETALFVE